MFVVIAENSEALEGSRKFFFLLKKRLLLLDMSLCYEVVRASLSAISIDEFNHRENDGMILLIINPP